MLCHNPDSGDSGKQTSNRCDQLDCWPGHDSAWQCSDRHQARQDPACVAFEWSGLCLVFHMDW